MADKKNLKDIQARVYGEIEETVERLFVWASTHPNVDLNDVRECVLLFGNGGTLEQIWDYYCTEYRTLESRFVEPD